MTKLFITLLSVLGFYAFAAGQCQASFTYSSTNGTVNFTNTSSGGGLFTTWNFGDGNSSYQDSPSHTYNATGNYIVCLSIFDSLSQCQDAYCDTIFVQADSTGGNNCNMTSSAYGSGGTIVGTASGAAMYDWIVYDGSWNFLYNTNNPNFNYNPGTNGLYNVCLTGYDSQQNICDSTCYMVQIQDSTGGNGCLSSSSAAFNQNGTIVGTATGASMYNWTVYDASWMYLHSTSNSNLNYTPNAQGTFNVCLIAYDSLQVECDSICYTLVSDSLASLTNSSEEIVVNIYPNPTHGLVHLELSNDHISEIVLMDVTGSILLQQRISASTTDIDLSLYPKGLYFIHALGRKGQRLSTSKVLRQ